MRFLSQIDWRATFVFLALRVGAASIALIVIFLFTAVPSGEMGAGELVVMPILVLFLGGVTLILAWLSQVGVPFVGILSYATGLPLYVGDVLVWILHKIRPDFVPVDEPGFLNPPLTWVMKGVN